MWLFFDILSESINKAVTAANRRGRVGLNSRMAVIVVDVTEQFYCIRYLFIYFVSLYISIHARRVSVAHINGASYRSPFVFVASTLALIMRVNIVCIFSRQNLRLIFKVLKPLMTFLREYHQLFSEAITQI